MEHVSQALTRNTDSAIEFLLHLDVRVPVVETVDVKTVAFNVTLYLPRFGTPLNNLTVSVGREAVFTCIVENLGPYKELSGDEIPINLESHLADIFHSFSTLRSYKKQELDMLMILRRLRFLVKQQHTCCRTIHETEASVIKEEMPLKKNTFRITFPVSPEILAFVRTLPKFPKRKITHNINLIHDIPQSVSYCLILRKLFTSLFSLVLVLRTMCLIRKSLSQRLRIKIYRYYSSLPLGALKNFALRISDSRLVEWINVTDLNLNGLGYVFSKVCAKSITTKNTDKEKKIAGLVPHLLENPLANDTNGIQTESLMKLLTETILFKVAWLRVDTQTILTIATHVITKNHRIAVTHSGHRRWCLHIRDTKETDRGWYMCQVNTDPMSSNTGFLEVVEMRDTKTVYDEQYEVCQMSLLRIIPPDILDDSTSTDMEVQEGSNVTLRCAATGTPKPKVTWRREIGGTIAQSNSHEESSYVQRRNEELEILVAGNWKLETKLAVGV
ncbi:Lachesin [Melipona quadrifasciata]|uniref:Lachesin n=1 Tax=Melipona quadrifasciata TaxID=166423 RepID=A0A0M8ZSX7_9HYME|nr:Lachesin [Melipona quadrifasciata]